MNFDLTAEQKSVQKIARRFAMEDVAPIARQMDEEGNMPAEIILRMGEIGLLGGPLPTGYGGGGWDHVSLALAYEELGRVDSSVRGFMTVHSSLVSQCLLLWGSDEQKQAYLPQLASGEMIGCYCLTEPNAGSDAASIETEAIEENGEYVLNGEKIWITNGGIADLALVFATRDPAARHSGISAFLVECDNSGLAREGMPGSELGHRASDHARMLFGNCRVPGSSLLGGEGEGFKVAMSALSVVDGAIRLYLARS